MSRRLRAHIAGWGAYLPARVLTNADLAQMVDTSDEWIRERTGIAERRIAAADETTASMATQAAEAALRCAGADPAATDLIIVATVSPDYPFPATACLVQHNLGASHAGAFDLEAGCSGFAYGLAMAAAAVESGRSIRSWLSAPKRYRGWWIGRTATRAFSSATERELWSCGAKPARQKCSRP